MSREEFVAAIVQSPHPGQEGQVIFDFTEVNGAPCAQFVYTPVTAWDDEGHAIEECWQEYLMEFETDWTEV